ncbi:hypothetical protein EBN03_08295 [Nocardia stercoris]|uniref:Uncharacterized protein n=1 Tax=Nocardia stercoris TaxID=2483361 RepID=A0A3M2L9V3_9NOCA|nr:hypothetical protein EBN03_08295 [Nocardia stercoris]
MHNVADADSGAELVAAAAVVVGSAAVEVWVTGARVDEVTDTEVGSFRRSPLASEPELPEQADRAQINRPAATAAAENRVIESYSS